MNMQRLRNNHNGFTLIEVVVVIVITGILLTVALGTGKKITDTARTEQTLNELDHLAAAIVGDPASYSSGTRSAYGYVGDVGALPPNLGALVTNPGSYATWNGPYVGNQFEQLSTDYQKDAWQVDYVYSGGTTITSTGSGENITRQLAGSADALLRNRLEGNVYDINGTPPGNDYKDSLVATLTFPDGAGGLKTVTVVPDQSGYFSLDSIPLGNHDLTVVYLPTSDTVRRFVSILPGSDSYQELRTTISWTPTSAPGSGSGIEYVSGSADVQTGNCDRIEFDITNTSSTAIDVSSLVVSWGSPSSSYEEIRWDNDEVVDFHHSEIASGETATFDHTKSINPGETVTIRLDNFESYHHHGGYSVDMSNVDFTVTFSDGSVITFNSGSCW
jgi:prepilin-type N-terminal cleavage/methylation domain-containing protein